MAPLSRDRLALLRAALAAKGLSAPCSALIPRREGAAAPLTSAQERLYFLELYQPGTALYNDTIAVRIEGPLDVERLQRALQRIQARHEVLRCHIRLAGDGARHEFEESCGLPLRVLQLERDGPGKSALAVAEQDARTPFDLENGPAWRALLVADGAEDWLLAVTMHHIISDGVSMGLFCDELASLYAADGDCLDALAIQFGDYATWERARGEVHDEQAHAEYWRQKLGGRLPALTWKEARGSADQRGAQVPLRFPDSTRARLEALSRSEGLTSNQLLLTAWFALLQYASGAEDLRTGVASSLRKQRELEPLIGFFVQSLVLRVGLKGDPTFRQACKRVRGVSLEADEHAELPFDRVLRALEPGAGASPGTAPPLLTTFFSHMRDAIRPPRITGTRTSWAFVDPGVARFELSLIVHESPAGLDGFLEYDLGLFEPATAEDLAAGFVRIVEAVLDNPDIRLSQLGELCSRESGGARRILPFPSTLRRTGGET
jgi:hypothetical protein